MKRVFIVFAFFAPSKWVSEYFETHGFHLRQEYFLLAMIFMFLNLVGHCVSFYLDSVGRRVGLFFERRRCHPTKQRALPVSGSFALGDR